MNLKKIEELQIYTRAEQIQIVDLSLNLEIEEEVKVETVYDRPTTLTNEQVQKFLCDESLKLQFHTSPYSNQANTKLHRQNEMSLNMGCEIFRMFNGTHNNTVAHF